MKLSKQLAVTCSSLFFLSACGVPSMFENTVELDSGYKISVAIVQPNLKKGELNPIASMMLIRGWSKRITGNKAAFLEAAEKRSGCKALEDKFLMSSMYESAVVELEC